MNQLYYLPAEWEKQSGVIITWPHRYNGWITYLAQIEAFYIALAEAISQYEKLLVIAYDPTHQQHILALIKKTSADIEQIRFFIAESNGIWIRDYGPIVLRNETQKKLLDFDFNAWGNKYAFDKDKVINTQLLQHKILQSQHTESLEFVLEGGSIDCDGQGSLLTTRQCLLNKNRNPEVSPLEIEAFLKDTLHIERILWLSEGEIVGDDTDGHIDMQARFTSPHTIVYASCENEADQHYLPLNKMKTELTSFRTRQGLAYELQALPIPSPIYDADGKRCPASYTNFLIINGAVLLPVYNDSNDAIAIDVLQSCFPDRHIIPLDARVPITQGGSLHCLTMQLIDGVLA